MQIIDLFSGVGGFSIAGHQLGWETILFCEKEPFPQQVLMERFPGVPIFDDVCKLTGETINGLIQSDRPIIFTLGFPCQPFSVAGAREGTEDDRHLWPEGFRLIKSVRPDYIIGENVPGLLSIEGGMVFEQVCLDLESEGYEVQAFVLPACATGAPHRRDRVWIVGHSKEAKQQRTGGTWPGRTGLADTNSWAIGNAENQEQRESAIGGVWPQPGDSDSGATSNTNEIGINRCSPSGSNEREQPKDSEQSGSGRTSETGGYVGERIVTDTQQIGHGRRSNTNGIGTEREIHQDFGHDRNGIRSEVEGCDRVTENSGSSGCQHGINDQQGSSGDFGESGTGGNEWDIDAEDDSDTGFQGHQRSEFTRTHGERPGQGESHRPITELYSGNYWHDWPSISPFHSGYDGISDDLVRHIRASLAEAGETPENIEAYIRKEANWLRKQAIMAAGNAVVPTVVLQVMKAIQNHYDLPRHNPNHPDRTQTAEPNSSTNGRPPAHESGRL